jgi:hypothetical protein
VGSLAIVSTALCLLDDQNDGLEYPQRKIYIKTSVIFAIKNQDDF